MENYKDIDYTSADSASNAVSNGFVLDVATLSKNDKLQIPVSESTLNAEVLKKSDTYQAEPTVKSAQLSQPSPKLEESPKLTSPQQISAIAATSGNVAAIASTPTIQIPGQPASITNTTINNNITKSESADVSNSVVNLTKVLKEAISEKSTTATASTDYINNFFETLIGGPTSKSIDKTQISQKPSPSTDSKISNILKSTVESKTTSTEEDIQTKKNEAMLNTLLGISNTSETTEINKTDINKTNTNESVNLKSTKLVESASVKKLLEPDKTLEKSVGKLSKDLPAAVNNLSSSVTSMNPQTSSSSSVTNEGTKIDQSSKTVINQMTGQSGPQQPTTQSKEITQTPQGNDFYIQAIYSALMSGKIKVTLNYQ